MGQKIRVLYGIGHPYFCGVMRKAKGGGPKAVRLDGVVQQGEGVDDLSMCVARMRQ